MTDKIFFRPIVPLLLSMISGIALGSWLPDFNVWAYGVVAVCFGIALWNIRYSKTVVITPIVLFAALGYLSIQSWVVPELPPNHVIHYADTHPWKIVGVIDTPPVEKSNRRKFILNIETLGENNKSFPVFGKIRVTVAGGAPKLYMGDRVFLTSKIRSIKNFNNPGGFDYKRYMAFKKVRATAYVSWEKIVVIKRNSKIGFRRIVEDARRKIFSLIETTGKGNQQGVLKALIVGDRSSIPKELRETFNRAGVGHLLAISGLHIGIVATAAFIFFQWVLSHSKVFLWNAWTKKGAVFLSVVPVLVYGLLSGMSPSTQRAIIMVIIFLMSFLFERDPEPMNTLALAAMLILVVHPPSFFSISFQLSFTAVLTIIYGLSCVQNPWISDVGRIKKNQRLIFYKKLFYFFSATLFAILGTLPLLMFYFNQISLVGFFANFIIVPLIGFIIVPLGLLSVFLYPLTIFGASYCLNICSSVLTHALYIIEFFADLPFAAIKTITPTYFEIFCFYILFWAVLNLKHHQVILLKDQKKIQGTLHKEHRVKVRERRSILLRKPALLIVLICIFAFSTDALYWLYHRFWHDDLRVTIIDVGHGSASLLELPNGHTILVDGGGFSDNSVFDVGARIVAPFLWRKKIKTVDTIILSHPNSDHLNGLIYIAENFNVKNVWSNNETSGNVGYRNFLKVIQKNRIHMPEYEKIFRSHHVNGVSLDICYPPADFIERQKQEGWRDVNNNSLVVKIAFGSKSIIFPGDIKARAEKELVSMAGDRLKSTVLVAPHHGSRTSSSELFLRKVNPETVIISSGRQSKFGFPHASVLQRYQEKGCRILSTSRYGAIIISTDGQTLSIKPTLITAE